MTPMTKVALGLFGAWAVHDLEELMTMGRSSREILPRLPQRLPVPEALRRDGVSPQHAGLSIAMMGALTAAAAAEGVRTQGRSALFRGGVLAFGLHGFSHLMMAGAARRYVTGVATAPTLVIPYWVWARRRLAQRGIPAADGRATAVALAVGPVLVGIHVLTYRLLRR
ncbi:HXXEE domain-containing protein [Amorphoplanes nipponensis]|uniref:Membrane protein n=1 Tax=Actinoplanes nipponensis TaxID=135950 RepID=A0A919JDN4_9ACTN|nr:HXXEE domain-containing protein [Actinoplanes nipponensis]GIE47022.1 membrane protein [Actinoplanes nipponensis]